MLLEFELFSDNVEALYIQVISVKLCQKQRAKYHLAFLSMASTIPAHSE